MLSSGPSQPTSNLLSRAANTELISIQEILFPIHILGPKPNGKLTNGLICGNINIVYILHGSHKVAHLHVRATSPSVWQELFWVTDPGGAVAHSLMAENEGGPWRQLIALPSFTGVDRDGRLELSRISHTVTLRYLCCIWTHLMLAGDVGNILMDSFITEFR